MQPHGVVDAHAARMAQACAQRSDEGRESAGRQRARRKCRQAPVLTVGIVEIGRRADLEADQHIVLGCSRHGCRRCSCRPRDRRSGRCASRLCLGLALRGRNATDRRSIAESNGMEPPRCRRRANARDLRAFRIAPRSANRANSRPASAAIWPHAALRRARDLAAARPRRRETARNPPQARCVPAARSVAKKSSNRRRKHRHLGAGCDSANRSAVDAPSSAAAAPKPASSSAARRDRRQTAAGVGVKRIVEKPARRRIRTEMPWIGRKQRVHGTERQRVGRRAAASSASAITPAISPMPQSPALRRP